MILAPTGIWMICIIKGIMAMDTPDRVLTSMLTGTISGLLGYRDGEIIGAGIGHDPENVIRA